MRPHELESWVLNIAERVSRGDPVEDVRVELKAEWPQPAKAARRIAGHANASRGDPILWVIGIDEKLGVIGAQPEAVHDWWPKVERHFDGIAPTLTDLNVPMSPSKTVVALFFATDRAPYVVKVAEGGTISHEVPWRGATRIRSAKRSELIQLLVPQQRLPDVEVLSASLTAHLHEKASEEKRLEWELAIAAYVTPRGDDMLVLPFHRCKASIRVSSATLNVPRVTLRPLAHIRAIARGHEPRLGFIDGTADEAIIEGPGRVAINAVTSTPMWAGGRPANPAFVGVELRIVRSDVPVLLDLRLESLPTPTVGWAQWQWDPEE
jgi:hypothetical protein